MFPVLNDVFVYLKVLMHITGDKIINSERTNSGLLFNT